MLDWALLGAGFLAVTLLLASLDLGNTPFQPAGDVTGAYRFWVDYWHSEGVLVGIQVPWVYPIGALPPMLLASVLGDDAYLKVWLVMVAVLDAAALVLLARRGLLLAWWWIAFTLLLGPVAPARIDAVALPFAVVGVLLVAERPGVASALLTLAAWIKVWPAAMVGAVLLAGRRTANVVTGAALTSAVVIGLALLAGGRSTIFSFIGAQATRGVQIEAPVAVPWMWSVALGDPDVAVYYDMSILTWQLRGPGVLAAAEAMTPVLAIGMLVVVLLALLARLRGVDPAQVLACSSLGAVGAVVALNKVGSPQYLTWYVAPILLGLLVDRRGFAVPAVLALAAAGLTQIIYPWHYGEVTAPTPALVAVLTVRDALELGLFAWSLIALRSARPPARLRTRIPMPPEEHRAPA